MVSWKLKTSHCQPIGLDIGHSFIKMIQLAINGEYVRILAADKVRIDPGVNGDEQARRNFVISAIKQMLAEGNFYGRNVVAALPNDKLKITSLRLAEGEEEKVEQALRKEASVRFGLDPDKDVINHLVAGNVQQGDEIKTELILFAADNETIRDHIAMLEEAKLRPSGIDAIPCALFRSFGRFLRRQEDRERTVVFVDLGSRYTTVVFGRDGEISFVKQIPIGGEKFNQQIASKLGIGINEAEMLRGTLRMEKTSSDTYSQAVPVGENRKIEAQSSVNGESPIGTVVKEVENQGGFPALQEEQKSSGLDASTRQVMVDAIREVAEELAREVSLCFRYYTVTFRGKCVERAVFTGGEAYESILLDVLKRRLAVEIELAQPLRGFDMTNVKFDGCKRGLLCEWAVAVGLSLKGWESPVPIIKKGEAPQMHKRAFDSEDNYERN